MQITVNDGFIELIGCKSRYLVLKGSAGSGKSYFAAQKILIRVLTEKSHRFLAVRKVAATLRGSVYQLFRDLIIDYNLYSEFDINKTEMRFTHKLTGNEILLAGLDDVEKLKSIQGVTGIWMEEADVDEESDLNQLDLRLRGETVNYKQIILTFNPVSEKSWLKKRFFDEPDTDATIHESSYMNNDFIDAEYKRILTEKFEANQNFYRIYVLNQWGKITTGSEFYYNFSITKHVKPCQYNPDLPIHVSFDFNVVPYMPVGIFQLEKINGIYHVKMIEEICLKNPRNNTEDAAKEVRALYDYKGIYIYGDATGRARSTQSKEHNYDIIQRTLKVSDQAIRVPRANPGLFKRRIFMNNMLFGKYPIQLTIDPSCVNAIADFENVKEDENGGKLKTRTKDKESGQSYEEYGHLSDVNDYLFVELFASYYENI